jgi:hypothetical protein
MFLFICLLIYLSFNNAVSTSEYMVVDFNGKMTTE